MRKLRKILLSRLQSLNKKMKFQWSTPRKTPMLLLTSLLFKLFKKMPKKSNSLTHKKMSKLRIMKN